MSSGARTRNSPRYRLWRRGVFSPAEAVDLLGPNFLVSQTQYSAVARDGRGRSVAWSDSWIGDGLIRRIGQLKAHVRRNLPAELREATSSPQRMPSASGGQWPETKHVVEVDIRKAYAHAAYRLGFINEMWLQYLLSVTRRSRLLLVGSLATVHYVTEFRHGKPAGPAKRQVDHPLRCAYAEIVSYVNETMLTIIRTIGGAYWVDAAFLPDSQRVIEVARQVIADAGLESHEPVRLPLRLSRSRRLVFAGPRPFPASL